MRKISKYHTKYQKPYFNFITKNYHYLAVRKIPKFADFLQQFWRLSSAVANKCDWLLFMMISLLHLFQHRLYNNTNYCKLRSFLTLAICQLRRRNELLTKRTASLPVMAVSVVTLEEMILLPLYRRWYNNFPNFFRYHWRRWRLLDATTAAHPKTSLLATIIGRHAPFIQLL